MAPAPAGGKPLTLSHSQLGPSELTRRLGVLDASEIPPTYSAPPDTFVALIAGGDYALRHAKEGAEDSRSAAEEDLAQHAFDPRLDSLIGIASSGRTPYVLGGLAYVRSVGGVTGALVCVEPSAVAAEGNADFLIAPVTGPEAVTGSTRMKAGTATKLVLNMISTGVMVSLGKTYGNLVSFGFFFFLEGFFFFGFPIWVARAAV